MPLLLTSDPVPDAALMDRMAQRDATALSELQRRYWGSLYAQVYGILKDARRANRVVAEAFEQAWHGAAQTSQQRPATLSWLRDVARQLAWADRAAAQSQ
jgi:RNA polymerase sigma-70 factor (ECF subfamily)